MQHYTFRRIHVRKLTEMPRTDNLFADSTKIITRLKDGSVPR